MAQVVEECEIGTLVTTMKTKNFQQVPVIYSMVSPILKLIRFTRALSFFNHYRSHLEVLKFLNIQF